MPLVELAVSSQMLAGYWSNIEWRRSMSHRRAFTLPELLALVAITAILIGLSLPAIQKAREAASQTRCYNQLRQLALGVHNHSATHNEKFPGLIDGKSKLTGKVSSFSIALLPFIEQDAVFQKIHASPHGNYSFSIGVYLCPSDPTVPVPSSAVGCMSYAANAQAFAGKPTLSGTFRDGTSQTILFAERYAVSPGRWSFSWPVAMNSRAPGGNFLSRRPAFALHFPMKT